MPGQSWRSASLEDLASRLAAPGPAPAAGAAAAAACAFVAALVELALGDGDPEEGRAAQLRQRALELLDADAPAFEELAAARGGGDPGALEAARRTASAPPLAIAETAAELADLATGAAARAAARRSADAAAAAQLARGAGLAAVSLVEANLAGLDGEPQLARARELAGRLRSAEEPR